MNVPQFIYGTNDDNQRFFALLVQQMQLALSNNGWTFPQLSNANVATITASTFIPVMPFGTTWANTDLKKLQFITNPAVPGVSNATIETITSA